MKIFIENKIMFGKESKRVKRRETVNHINVEDDYRNILTEMKKVGERWTQSERKRTLK